MNKIYIFLKKKCQGHKKYTIEFYLSLFLVYIFGFILMMPYIFLPLRPIFCFLFGVSLTIQTICVLYLFGKLSLKYINYLTDKLHDGVTK